VSVVTPVVAAYGGLTVVLAVIFLGEVLHPYHFVGIVLILLGIVLVTRSAPRQRGASGDPSVQTKES